MIQSLKEKRYLRINAENFVEMWRPVKNDEYGLGQWFNIYRIRLLANEDSVSQVQVTV